ncbi:MAG: acetyl-CoA carboxylase biotin carboxyl carrier protein [Oscillospiraceae bacterium]|nr:acetyl-CoA carboxylase biotin carboxyl carrier protein [Oscillospiraceae bacterium]
MDIIKTVNEIADILNEKNLSKISVKADSIEFCIEAKQAVPVNFAAPVPVIPASSPITSVSGSAETGSFIKSPIVGTFYAAPAADKPPFIKVGDRIEKGKVVCIVESMKLMNEIISEYNGTVAEIYVKDGEAVEYDQKMIKIT